MAETVNILKTALEKNKITLTEPAQQQLLNYLALMQNWNRVYNLTSITDPSDMVYLHIIDSLVIDPYLHGITNLDVGTGAGLPGIPLAITRPDKQWTLLDKNSKKTRFLTQAVAELKLTNVNITHNRCEDFHPPSGFDSILSRAFGSLQMFAETTEHLLNERGMLIAMKGKYPEEELKHIPEHFQLVDVTQLNVKGIDIERHLIRLSLKSAGA